MRDRDSGRRANTGLRPGDVVRRPKGPVDHVGVVLDGGQVLHNVPGRGEHVSSLAEFSAGKPVSVDRADTSQRLRTLAGAQRVGGRDYDLLRNNCEHTVSRARDGREASPQLAEYALGAVGAVAGLALLRHWAGAAGGFEAGRRLGRRLSRRR